MTYHRARELLLVLLLAFAALRLPATYDGLQMIAANAALVVAILVLVDALLDILVYGVRRYVDKRQSGV